MEHDVLSFQNSRGLPAAAGNLRSDFEYVLACEHQRRGNNVTLLINNADTAGIQSFTGFGPNAKLATAGSTLDLSHTTVSGFAVTSTNALGTAFTVGDLGTAFQIAGGSGQDTLIASGFTFSADQRNAIFATASVEKIVDQSGTYTVDNGRRLSPRTAAATRRRYPLPRTPPRSPL